MQMKFFRSTFRTIVVISGLLTSPLLYAELTSDPGAQPTATTDPVAVKPGTITATPTVTTTVTTTTERTRDLRGDRQALHQALNTFHADAKNVGLDKQLVRETQKRFGRQSTQAGAVLTQLKLDQTTRKTDLKAVVSDLKQVRTDQKSVDRPKMRTLDQAFSSQHEGRKHEAIRIVRVIIVEQHHERSHHHGFERRYEREHRREAAHERRQVADTSRTSQRFARR